VVIGLKPALCSLNAKPDATGLSNLKGFLHHQQDDDASRCFLLVSVLTYMQMVDGSSWSSATIYQIGLGIPNGFSLEFFWWNFFTRVKYSAFTSVVID